MRTMKRILLVDDEPDILSVYQERLTLHHFNCDTASSAKTALRKIPNFKPDLILLDICLAEISGLKLLQEIKTKPAHVRIPIVLLSGISDEGTVRKGLALGAVGYLNKTCSVRELLATVKHYTEK